jgi:hypothetical protein
VQSKTRQLIRAVVAIPAKNEEERINACLHSLNHQVGKDGRPIDAPSFGVVLVVNNSTDRTFEIACASSARLRVPILLIEVEFGGTLAHAGGARRLAMDVAANWLERAGHERSVILSTDADSCVPADWISANLAEIDAGVDAVAGLIVLDQEEEARLPAALRLRGGLEHCYEQLLTEISARLDPQAHNPWPTHWTGSGANFAVSLDAYRRIGGLPRLPIGEDRAILRELARHDCRIRHSPNIVVTTSGRLVGRAPGGVADTMKLRVERPNAACDENLERVASACRRFTCRAQLRRQARRGRVDAAAWARWLPASSFTIEASLKSGGFGALWDGLESTSPVLRKIPLQPVALPAQIALAYAVLTYLRIRDSAREIAGHRADNSDASRGPSCARAPAGSP